MAQYGKNNYFDGVILPEPKEEMLRRMAKGVNTTRGYLYARSIDIDKYNGDRSFQVAFTTGDDITTTQYIRTNYPLGLVISNDCMYVSMWGQWLLGYDVRSNTEYDVVVSFDVTTRASTLYVNGQLIATRLREDVAPNYSKTYFLGAYPEQTNLFTGDIALCREFNFQIPKAVVALLHNNGDPAGYVLPVPYKFRVADYISDFSENADGWEVPSTNPETTISTEDGALLVSGSSTTLGIWKPNMSSGNKPGIFRVRVAFAVPFTGSRIRFFAHSFNDYSDLTLSSDKLNAEGIVYINKGLDTAPVSFMYSYDVLIGDVVKLQSIIIESVGCVAEYLPQNLIPTAEDSVVQWLDSAPQLPEANGILPPLDASVGGYDLAAIGNPKIII